MTLIMGVSKSREMERGAWYKTIWRVNLIAELLPPTSYYSKKSYNKKYHKRNKNNDAQIVASNQKFAKI
jgi:hypothetical protein